MGNAYRFSAADLYLHKAKAAQDYSNMIPDVQEIKDYSQAKQQRSNQNAQQLFEQLQKTTFAFQQLLKTQQST